MGARQKAVDNEVGEMDRARFFRTLYFIGVSFFSTLLSPSVISLNTQKFVLKVLSFLYKLCQWVICFHWLPCFHSVEHLISFMLLVISHYVFMFIHEGQDSSVLRAIAGAVQPLHFLLLTCHSHPRVHPILVTDRTVVGIWLGLASSKSLKFFLCVWKIWLSLAFSFINNRETYSG